MSLITGLLFPFCQEHRQHTHNSKNKIQKKKRGGGIGLLGVIWGLIWNAQPLRVKFGFLQFYKFFLWKGCFFFNLMRMKLDYFEKCIICSEQQQKIEKCRPPQKKLFYFEGEKNKSNCWTPCWEKAEGRSKGDTVKWSWPGEVIVHSSWQFLPKTK